MSLPAKATDLALCPAAGGAGRTYFSATGDTIELVLGSAPDGCAAVTLPVAREAIRWAGLMPQGVQPGVPLALSGRFTAEAASVSDVESLEVSPPLPASPPTDPPLPRAFGVEERASVLSPGPVLDCGPGVRPAGMVLPVAGGPGPRVLSYRSTMPVTMGASDGRTDAEEIATAPASEARTVMLLPWRGQSHLTVACAGAGHFELLGIGPAMAGWAWSPRAWLENGNALIARARALGMDTLYVSVPVGEGRIESPAQLAAFIARARTVSIHVWVVDGDPHAVLPAERPRFVQRARAYADYNRSVPLGSRLAGLQLDIEPYVLPGYAQRPQAFDRAWARTVVEVSAAADMPVEAVIPFWFAVKPHRTDALDALAGTVAGVAVMAYRGDADGVAGAATPALDWGRRTGVPVRVAMENGPIPDEDRLVFRPAEMGTLWQVDVNGTWVMLLLERPAANPVGPTLALASRNQVPGRRVSFLGDEKALAEAVDALQTRLGGHPAFRGLAIHGILD